MARLRGEFSRLPILVAVLDKLAGKDDGRAALAVYWQRLQDRPGFRTATDRTGPMIPRL